MQTLVFIINDAPYGSEKPFNALRLAANIKEAYGDAVIVKLFLMSDAVSIALPHQRPAEGYNIQQLLEILLAQGAEIKLCKTCTDARGLTNHPLIEGAHIGTLIELSHWTMQADKVLTF
jgi:uncharacterized protein involved in oxidation of intracellular sulfur